MMMKMMTNLKIAMHQKKVVRSGIPIKKERATKKSPTSKSRAENTKVSSNIIMATEQMYQIALKSIISSVIPHCPKEILIEISKFINTIFPKIKDHCLNTVMENDTVKRRELAWENVTSNFQDILLPLLQSVNSEQKPLLQVPESSNKDVIMANSTKIEEINTSSSHALNHAIKAYAQCNLSEKKSDIIPIYWPKLLEINSLQIKDANDVATISCKVRGVTIPYAMIDSRSDSSIISENVTKHLDLKIDRKKIHRLNGVASKSQSLET